MVENANNSSIKSKVDKGSKVLVGARQEQVSQETKRQNGKVEGREVMMNIGDTGHDNEGQVVEKPAEGRNNTSHSVLLNLQISEILVATLPSGKIDKGGNTKNGNTLQSSTRW